MNSASPVPSSTEPIPDPNLSLEPTPTPEEPPKEKTVIAPQIIANLRQLFQLTINDSLLTISPQVVANQFASPFNTSPYYDLIFDQIVILYKKLTEKSIFEFDKLIYEKFKLDQHLNVFEMSLIENINKIIIKSNSGKMKPIQKKISQDVKKNNFEKNKNQKNQKKKNIFGIFSDHTNDDDDGEDDDIVDNHDDNYKDLKIRMFPTIPIDRHTPLSPSRSTSNYIENSINSNTPINKKPITIESNAINQGKQIMIEKQQEQIIFLKALLSQQNDENSKLITKLANLYASSAKILQKNQQLVEEIIISTTFGQEDDGYTSGSSSSSSSSSSKLLDGMAAGKNGLNGQKDGQKGPNRQKDGQNVEFGQNRSDLMKRKRIGEEISDTLEDAADDY